MVGAPWHTTRPCTGWPSSSKRCLLGVFPWTFKLDQPDPQIHNDSLPLVTRNTTHVSQWAPFHLKRQKDSFSNQTLKWKTKSRERTSFTFSASVTLCWTSHCLQTRSCRNWVGLDLPWLFTDVLHLLLVLGNMYWILTRSRQSSCSLFLTYADATKLQTKCMNLKTSAFELRLVANRIPLHVVVSIAARVVSQCAFVLLDICAQILWTFPVWSFSRWMSCGRTSITIKSHHARMGQNTPTLSPTRDGRVEDEHTDVMFDGD